MEKVFGDGNKIRLRKIQKNGKNREGRCSK